MRLTNKTPNPKFQIYKVLGLTLGVILILGLAANVQLPSRERSDEQNLIDSNVLAVESVSAAEIYPLFVCPCCGKTLEVGCCGMAKERQLYIDGLSQGKLSKEEIILAYVKKYGLSSFADEDKREEFRDKLVESAPVERPIITTNPSAYDFGEVRQKEGIVTTLFEIRNEGESDLVIDRLETSCGCTTASVVYQEKEGPKFGMPGHGVNESIENWQLVIPDGETAQLKVYYDPDVHPEFRGTAIRTISVFSNDPIDFEKKVQIELNQVD